MGRGTTARLPNIAEVNFTHLHLKKFSPFHSSFYSLIYGMFEKCPKLFPLRNINQKTDIYTSGGGGDGARGGGVIYGGGRFVGVKCLQVQKNERKLFS